MSIKFVRFTQNPSHKVVLGLCAAQTSEYVELENEQVEKLDDKAQQILARLRSAEGGQSITFQHYVPLVSWYSDNQSCSVLRYRGMDSLEQFAAPAPFTPNLILEWLGDLTARTIAVESEALVWCKNLEVRQETALENCDDESFLMQLKALTVGQTYISGPGEVRWYPSTEAVERKDRIEHTKRNIVKLAEKAEKERVKAARETFVENVVAALGDDNQRARLVANLLPMNEVGDLLHKAILAALTEYDCTDDAAITTIPEKPIKLTATQFDRYMAFKLALNSTTIPIKLDYEINPVIGHNDDNDNAIALAEVTIKDGGSSDWFTIRWYYLD